MTISPKFFLSSTSANDHLRLSGTKSNSECTQNAFGGYEEGPAAQSAVSVDRWRMKVRRRAKGRACCGPRAYESRYNTIECDTQGAWALSNRAVSR